MLYRIRQNNLYGFIDEKGTVVVQPEYDLVFDFQWEVCVVMRKEKYGMISATGEVLLKPEYVSLSILGGNRLCIRENKAKALANFHGKLLTPFEYDGIFPFSEGMAIAYKGLKFGYLSEDGKESIPFDFDFADAFQNGFAMVKQNNGYGLLNKKGIFEKSPRYDFYYAYKNCYVVNSGGTVFDDDVSGGKFGLLSKDNKELTKLEFDFIGPFINGEAIVKKEALYGTINEEGQIIEPIESSAVVKTKEEFQRMMKDRKHGLLKNETEELIPAVYDDLVVYPESWLCWAKQDGLYGILNFENIFVVPPIFDLSILYPIQNGHVHIELKNGKHGLLSVPSGQWLLPAEYDSIGVFKGSLVELKKEGKSGYANQEGKIVWME